MYECRITDSFVRKCGIEVRARNNTRCTIVSREFVEQTNRSCHVISIVVAAVHPIHMKALLSKTLQRLTTVWNGRNEPALQNVEDGCKYPRMQANPPERFDVLKVFDVAGSCFF